MNMILKNLADGLHSEISDKEIGSIVKIKTYDVQ